MHDVKRTAGSSSKWLSNANSLFLVTTHQISPDLRAFDQFLFPQVREFVFCPPLFFCSKVRIGSVWPGGCRLCKLWRARQVESPWHGWLGWLPCSQPLSVICPRQNWHPGHTQWFPNPKKMKPMAIWSHGNVRRFQVLKRYWRLNLALPISCMPFPSISMTSRSFTPMSSRLSLALAHQKGSFLLLLLHLGLLISVGLPQAAVQNLNAGIMNFLPSVEASTLTQSAQCVREGMMDIMK